MKEKCLRIASLMILIVALSAIQSAITPPAIRAQSGVQQCPTNPPCVGYCPPPTVCNLRVRTGTCVCI